MTWCMATNSRDPPDPEIKLINGSWRGLTQKHGIVIRLVDFTENEEYLDAISQVVSSKCILAAGRMTKRFVCFFSTLNDVEKVVLHGIELNGEHVHVDHYSKPANKIVISNVPPCIPNDILRPIIARKGEIVGEIKPIPLSSSKYRHIQSFRRSVSVILDRPVENISDSIEIYFDGQSHQIYLSSNQPKCFNCLDFGHISKFCPHMNEQRGATGPISSQGAPPQMHTSLQYSQVLRGTGRKQQTQSATVDKNVTHVHQDNDQNKIVKINEQSRKKLETMNTNVRKDTKVSNEKEIKSSERKVKKVSKRKADDQIVGTPGKLQNVVSEVRPLSSPLSSPHSSPLSRPRTSSLPLSGQSSHPSTPGSCSSRRVVDKIVWSTPQVITKKKSPIPISSNPVDVLSRNKFTGKSPDVIGSTPSKSLEQVTMNDMLISPICFTLPDDESRQISPLPSPLEFEQLSPNVLLKSPDMLSLVDLPSNSQNMSIDMNDSTYSVSDLNVSIHQDLTLTPPSDMELVDFFVNLKGAHKQVERCIDLKLDTRYLIQRLINIKSKNLVDDAEKSRLTSLIKKLVSHVGIDVSNKN